MTNYVRQAVRLDSGGEPDRRRVRQPGRGRHDWFGPRNQPSSTERFGDTRDWTKVSVTCSTGRGARLTRRQDACAISCLPWGGIPAAGEPGLRGWRKSAGSAFG